MGEWEAIRVGFARDAVWERALDEMAEDSAGMSTRQMRELLSVLYDEIQRDTWAAIATGSVAPTEAPPQKRTRGISLNGVI